MLLDIAQVDAFTSVPFGGNPAGVVPRADALTDDLMQRIAREMALSETAFVCAPTQPGADLRVRFFTPTQEIDLCGHATIGTFFYLAQEGLIPAITGKSLNPDGETLLHQQTRAGVLAVRIHCREGRVQRVMMSQQLPRVIATEVDPDVVAEVLGLSPSDIREAHAPAQVISTGVPDLLVPLNGLDALRRCRPDMAHLREFMAANDLVSVHPFTLETESPQATAQARDFAPTVGIPEESATGTANGALGAYLVLNRLAPAPMAPMTSPAPFASPAETPSAGAGTVRMLMEQGHTLGRPSQIQVEVDQDRLEDFGGRWTPAAAISGVRVGGQAVTVFRGVMNL